MFRNQLACFIVSMATLSSAGCCCTPRGVPVGAMAGGGCGAAPTVIGGGRLFGLAACRSGCGEVYVDEWISEPPMADNCGFACGGCGSCGQCQPVRNALRLLWGRPYTSSCCSESCDGGCDSCDGGGGMHMDGSISNSVGSSGCNCGEQHHGDSTIMHSAPALRTVPGGSSTAPMEVIPAPQQVPTPAPTVAPTSTKRLNPAQQRLNVRTAESKAVSRR